MVLDLKFCLEEEGWEKEEQEEERKKRKERNWLTFLCYTTYQRTVYAAPDSAGSWTILCRTHQLRKVRGEQKTWNINIIPCPKFGGNALTDPHFIHSPRIIGHPVAVLGTSMSKPDKVPERRKCRRQMSGRLRLRTQVKEGWMQLNWLDLPSPAPPCQRGNSKPRAIWPLFFSTSLFL